MLANEMKVEWYWLGLPKVLPDVGTDSWVCSAHPRFLLLSASFKDRMVGASTATLDMKHQ